MHFSLTSWLLLSAPLRALAAASMGGDIRDPVGLEHFVSRPDLIAPQLMIAKHHPEAISDGYWFITPYYDTNQRQRAKTIEYIPCQTGAHIYDGDGQLIWSGACKYDNRNIFAFSPVQLNGTQYLSFWLGHQFVGDEKSIPKEDIPSSAVLMSDSYEEVRRVFQWPFLDCHEVSFTPEGQTVLITRLFKEKRDLSPYGKAGNEVLHGAFRELSLATNEPVFDWDPVRSNVTLDESFDTLGKGSDVGDAWDYFHINSVDKTWSGDYIISARHTSTMYRISGVDGSVMWRLGGYFSDFLMDEGVPFFWQHHAKFIFENETHTIVSVFDNASDDFNRNPRIPQNAPAGKIILLDHSSWPMRASLIRRFDRPDGLRTPMGGSVFLQGDDPYTSNVLVNWVLPGYFSEYDSQNRLVFEGRLSKDIKTYRAIKAPFVGRPSEPIAFKVFPIGYEQDEVATSFYVSWNGATEVKSWAFYGSDTKDGEFRKLSAVKKRGFETSWVMPGVVQHAYVVALDKDDKELGKSTTVSMEPPAQMEGRYQAKLRVLEDAKTMYGPDYMTLRDPEAPAATSTAAREQLHIRQSGVMYRGGVSAAIRDLAVRNQLISPLRDEDRDGTAASVPLSRPPLVESELLRHDAPPPLHPPSTIAAPAAAPRTKPEQRIHHIVASTRSNNFSQLIIEAFAVFGLFTIARTLLQRRSLLRSGKTLYNYGYASHARGYSAHNMGDHLEKMYKD